MRDAENVEQQVRERNKPENLEPEPRGGLIHRQPDPDQLARLVDDPLTPAAVLEAKAEEMEATTATVKQRAAEKRRREAEDARREAERKRQELAADAELVQVLDAVWARLRELGFHTMATEIETAMVKHRETVAPLGVNSAVADRVVWSHPVARLLEWLEKFCSPR